MAIRVMLADDHNVVRAGLRALIDAQDGMKVVGEASDGAEVLELALASPPDVVVMDLSMPRLNGLEATAQLLRRSPAVRVLVLSVHEDPSYLRRAVSVGAAGYVLKRAAAESLIGALRVVSEGGFYLDPALGSVLSQGVIGEGGRAAGSEALLSDRESAVLRLIAQGYGNKEIAGQLDLSVKTVETYKARAMEKLGLVSRVDIVRFANTHGWFGAP